MKGIDVANRTAGSQAGVDLKCHAVAAVAITKVVYGNLWSFPTAKLLAKARTACSYASFGFKRLMRCVEIAITVLGNPVRVDPVGAIVQKHL